MKVSEIKIGSIFQVEASEFKYLIVGYSPHPIVSEACCVDVLTYSKDGKLCFNELTDHWLISQDDSIYLQSSMTSDLISLRTGEEWKYTILSEFENENAKYREKVIENLESRPLFSWISFKSLGVGTELSFQRSLQDKVSDGCAELFQRIRALKLTFDRVYEVQARYANQSFLGKLLGYTSSIGNRDLDSIFDAYSKISFHLAPVRNEFTLQSLAKELRAISGYLHPEAASAEFWRSQYIPQYSVEEIIHEMFPWRKLPENQKLSVQYQQFWKSRLKFEPRRSKNLSCSIVYYHPFGISESDDPQRLLPLQFMV